LKGADTISVLLRPLSQTVFVSPPPPTPQVDLTVTLPKDGPPPAAAAAATPEAAAPEAGGFVVEQTGAASMQGLAWELGAGGVVPPLEALVRALRPGGRGRVRCAGGRLGFADGLSLSGAAAACVRGE
jgi:hypothetical protein